jgi:hypothetical protein
MTVCPFLAVLFCAPGPSLHGLQGLGALQSALAGARQVAGAKHAVSDLVIQADVGAGIGQADRD